MPLTDEQKRAIESPKKNIVVSASAGSGKTSTMVLRVINLLKKGVPVDHIIMLTFTENAAHEMISRLADALFSEIREAKGAEKDLLVEAHDRLPMISCGTIHSFCYKLIMAHFEKLELSPLYTIVDETAAEALRARTFKKVVRERFTSLGEPFLDFLSRFDTTGDNNLKDSVEAVYKCMTSLEERETCLNDWAQICDKKVDDLDVVSYLLALKKKKSDTLIAEYTKLYQMAKDAGSAQISAQIVFRINCLKSNYSFDSLESLLCKCISPSSNGSTPQIRSEKNDVKFAGIYQRYLLLEKVRSDFEDEIKKLFSGLKDYEMLCKVYEKSSESVKELLALVRAFDVEYRKVKEDKKLLDFNDLEHYALQLLEQEDIRKEIACEHILVDEKQDVNPIQDRLVRLLSEDHCLFSVGDMKQSIFRFRHGAPEIFQGLMREGRADPEHSDVILFDKNFRSSQAVISFVNQVFTPIMTEKFGGVDYSEAPLRGRGELTPEGDLVPDLGFVDCHIIPIPAAPRTTAPVLTEPYDLIAADRIVKAKNAVSDPEVDWVIERIREVVGTKQYDPKEKKYITIGYGDIAILASKRGPLPARLIARLREEHIPISLGAFKTESKEPETEQLADLMRLVLSPHDDYAFVSVMRSPMFEFDLEEIARISLEEGATYYDKAVVYASRAGGEKVRAFLSYLDKVRFDSSVLSVEDLLSHVIEEKFRLSLLREADGRLRFGTLRAFVGEVRLKHLTSVAEFIDYFDNEYQGAAAEVADLNAIRFMTIHTSKGLEFPVVFVIDTGRDIISSKDQAPLVVDKQFGVQKHIVELDGVEKVNFAYKAVKGQKDRESLEDAIRLLYVALTRAKYVLYVSGKIPASRLGVMLSSDDAQTMAEWILFSVPTLPHGTPVTDVPDVDAPEKKEDGSVFVEEKDILPASPEMAKGVLKEAFGYKYPYATATTTGIKYTVTGINNSEEDTFASKPLFAEDKTALGTVMHAVMEEIPFTVTEQNEVDECLADLVARGTLREEDAKKVDAAVILDAVRQIRKHTAGRTLLREKTFMLQLPASDIHIDNVSDNVVVQGKVDLLALGEKDAIIVDYKFSSASDDALRKKYREQLSLYARAVQDAMGLESSAYIFVLGRNYLLEIPLKNKKGGLS